MIDFLRGRYNDSKKNALILLLYVLADRIPDGDSCKSQLVKLAKELEVKMTVPIVVLDATNFLFDEANKILQERRERRQTKSTSVDVQKNEQSQNIITSKDSALRQNIDKNTWLNSNAELEHLLSLLEVHTRNYYLAKEQYAKWGSALVPPIIVNNLVEAEDEVEKATQKLQNILSKIYGKQVNILEVKW